MFEKISIPRDLSKETETLLLELQDQNIVGDHVLDACLDWILETPFADKPSRAWIGEIAATLLRKHAPLNREKIWSAFQQTNDWQLHFLLMALIDEKDSPQFHDQLNRAAGSDQPIVNAHAEELLWTLKENNAKSAP